jgi:hypothetical protein
VPAEELATISGRAHLQAPPTPALVVFAYDPESGIWAYIDTQATDDEASFSISVPPGSYQLFACIRDGDACSLGYSVDGWSLATVSVAAGETVADIMVRPPSQSECGATFGLPASPDGRFLGTEGPSEACLEAAQTGTDLTPLGTDECATLAGALELNLGIAGQTVEVPYTDYIANRSGTACETTISGTGAWFSDLPSTFDDAKATVLGLGWEEDTLVGAAGGPGAMATGFRQAGKQCRLLVYWEPSDEADCPTDQPIHSCEVDPEQKVYTILLACAQEPGADAFTMPGTHPEIIQFDPGAVSAQLTGTLAPGGLVPYALFAGAGQEMTVNLFASAGGSAAPGSAILSIWGLDGTVLISNHADATTWSGVLPLSQDYYIDVISIAQEEVDYKLEVIILSAGETGPVSGQPVVVPANFELVVRDLAPTGVPPVLPAEFSSDASLPAIFPHLYLTEPGLYELDLGYGADCYGAGACHYGSLTGKRVDSDQPVGTPTFPFEAERAVEVTLVDGTTGFFLEAVCGANCSDATLFWIADGYQYMVGLKGAPQADVVALANAAILNFAP